MAIIGKDGVKYSYDCEDMIQPFFKKSFFFFCLRYIVL